MMKKHIPRGASPLLAALLLLGFLFSRCDKPPDLTEEEKLPAATQEGKGTFGCLVDGKAWVPKGSGILDPAIDFSFDELSGELQIFAQKFFGSNLDRQYVKIAEIGIHDTNDYAFTAGVQNVYIDTIKMCNDLTITDTKYQCINGGVLSITTLDFLKGIISGRFEFDAIRQECQDTIAITQGRFDIRYK